MPGTKLRACYAVSGTKRAYAATRRADILFSLLFCPCKTSLSSSLLRPCSFPLPPSRSLSLAPSHPRSSAGAY
eukprot:979808-Rhodomonas_salina.1